MYILVIICGGRYPALLNDVEHDVRVCGCLCAALYAG